MTSELREIHPGHSPLTVVQATSGMRLGDLAPPDRPYVGLNMVSTVDGAAAVEGRTRALGDEVDRALFHGLRTQADCVMVGAGTARVERYGRIVRDPERREQRRREGLASDPLACIVSARLDLPQDLPLLADPDSSVVVVTAAEHQLGETPARVSYMREVDPAPGPRRPRLRAALEHLRDDHGVRSVLCEGGPTLNRSLLGEGLVDELFVTLAPKLVGGTPELTMVFGERPPAPRDLELVSCLEARSSLFLRYRLR